MNQIPSRPAGRQTGDRSHKALKLRTLLLVSFLLLSAISAHGQTNFLIYDDALQNGWQDWSWCIRALTNPAPVHSGIKSFSATCGAWEAVSLGHSAFATTAYSNLVFWAHGGTAGGQMLHLMAQRSSGNPTHFVWAGPLAAGSWQRFSVSLASLGVAEVSDCTVFWIRNNGANALPTFYLDDIALETPTQPPLPPVGSTISLEAERGVLNGVAISTAVAGYSGSGYVTGFDATGDAVSWTFSANPGRHRLWIRFRSPYGPKGFDATLNSATISGTFPQTNSFGMFDMGLVDLVTGWNTLQIGGGWNYYEIDRADFVPTTAPPSPLPVPAMLSDPQATFAARMLMADLVADYGKVTWAGQMEPSEATNAFNITGRRPVIVSADFMDYSPSRITYGANPGNLTERVIALDNLGHALSMCWHWNAPTNLLNTTGHEWWSGFYTHASTFDVAAALANTNSTEYALLRRDMDAIAAQLKKFASNNIPVLWRPLHESEGGWFWWGAKGPEPFRQLWRLLHSRLTHYHGLHNLIWVLTSEDPAWYPGNDVVDIIGVDGYPTDKGDPLSSRWEALKARFDGTKLIALTEFGGVPDVPKMQRLGVWFSYFLPWTGTYGPTGMPAETVVRVYQSTNVVTLEEANAIPSRIVTSGRTNSLMQLAVKGTRGATHRLLASTNATRPVVSWTPIATNKFPGGVFTFTDAKATNFPVRFYRVVKP